MALWFCNHTKTKLWLVKSNITLAKTVETRFGTHFLCIDRLYKARHKLLDLYEQDEYRAWAATKSADKRADIHNILEDHDFWKMCEYTLKLLEPAMHALRQLDVPGPTVGKVYATLAALDNWFLLAFAERFPDQRFTQQELTHVHASWMKRWEQVKIALIHRTLELTCHGRLTAISITSLI